MSREVCDLMKLFLFPSNTMVKSDPLVSTSTASHMQQSTSASADQPIHTDDNLMDNAEDELSLTKQPTVDKEDTNNILSDMAVSLLKHNKNIYQSTLLLLFEGLTWPDSYCCARFVRMSLALFEKYRLSYEAVCVDESMNSPFVIVLNAPISEHLFKCCLSALQTHGEHADLTSLLMNLGFVLYEKSSSGIQEALNRTFSQIPNLNRKLFDEYLEKMQRGNKENKTNNDKLKKDCNQLFKKMLQPIVGKSVGQLYKNDIKINNLQPLNILKRNENKTEEIFNICSLFDPNY